MNEGEESRAFAFEVGEEAYVVRVNAAAESFEMDRLIGDALCGGPIPVPVVVLVTPLDGGGFACVSRRLPGETLQALPQGGAFAYGPAVAHVLNQLASPNSSIADRLATSPLMAQQESWPDFVAAVTRLDWTQADSGARRSVDQWTNLVAGCVARLPQRLGLVHGDFGSNNVLVSSGAVSGVLDWSEARIGDPLYDVANILFWRSWLDCMEQQSRYFEQQESWRLVERDALGCYQLRIGLMTLHEAFAEGNSRLIAWTMRRCATIAAET